MGQTKEFVSCDIQGLSTLVLRKLSQEAPRCLVPWCEAKAHNHTRKANLFHKKAHKPYFYLIDCAQRYKAFLTFFQISLL